jgi:O-antigen/teichoic acid export membrane protein
MNVATLMRLPFTRSGASKLSLTFADQAVASASNVALMLFVAHNVDATRFGAFTVVIGVYLVTTQIGRASIGEPLLIKYPGRRCTKARAGFVLTASLQLGFALGAPVAVAAVLAPNELQLGLAALALALPGLMAQDALRYIAFTRDRPSLALWNDLIWAGLQLAFTWLLLEAGTPSTGFLVAAWAAAGAIAALVSMAASALRPRSGGRWFRTTGYLGTRYVVESVAATGTLQLVTIGVAVFGGYGSAGALRLAQTVFGPINLIYTAMRVSLLTKLSHNLSNGVRLVPTAIFSSLALATIPVFVMLILWLTPNSILTSILGPTGPEVQQLLPLIFAQKVAACIGLGGIGILRVQQRAGETQRISIINSVIVLAIASLLIPLASAVGAAAALLIGSAANSLSFWRHALNARESSDRVEGRT